MKIALMTWFEYENFGTVLQASALYNVLKSNFGHTDIIDYRTRKPHWVNSFSYKDALVRRLNRKKELVRYSSIERSKLFDSYIRDNITVTNPVNSYPELVMLNDEYDAFVCGSDQIWTPDSGDLNYYLPFVNTPQKRIAYAPSFGLSRVDDNRLEKAIAKELTKFDHLSSREIQGVEIVKKISGRESTLVADPTLLLTKEEWQAYLNLDRKGRTLKPRSYVLCYFLGDFRNYTDSVREVSKSLNLPVKVIPIWKEQGNGNIGYEVGPKEFVELFLNAGYVCTDSFHGVAFSVNFNIPFSVFRRFSDKDPRSQNSRIISFLEITGLSARLHDAKTKADLQCDFTEPNRLLSNLRNDSYQYLHNALDGIGSCRIGAREKKKREVPISLAEYCSGCGACAAVCPKNAISIIIDKNGFHSYTIDESLCIRCGKCVSICPMISVKSPQLRKAKGLYSFKAANSETLAASSSGGIGAILAQMLLSQGSRVFGCKYDQETNTALHVEVNNDSLDAIKGSKYIQSNSAEAMKKIYESDGNIAFFGTPCQVAAANALLDSRGLRDKATLVELVCHGVPSQLLWERYLNDLSGNYKTGKHPYVIFRDKKFGWGPNKRITIINEKGEVAYSASDETDCFYTFFNNSIFNAQCCYECPFRERSCADIRIGDYWGARFKGDQEGVSMVVALTNLGAMLVSKCSELGILHRYPIKEYWTSQYPFNFGAPLFWDDLAADVRRGDESLKHITWKYAKPFLQRNMLKKVKAFILRAEK